jgi:hypothetical protein
MVAYNLLKSVHTVNVTPTPRSNSVISAIL